LARRVDQPNAFFQPEFLIPLWKHTSLESNPQLLVVWDLNDRLMSLSFLQRGENSPRLPFRHLKSFQHHYLLSEQMLIDRNSHDLVIKTVFNWLAESPYRHGLEVQEFRSPDKVDFPVSHLAQEMGVNTFVEREWQRAACVVDQSSTSGFLKTHCSKSRRKTLNRARKKLNENGPVSFSFIHGKAVTDQHLRTFLKLESMGWKGEAGTAIFCQRKDLAFFVEMVQRMSQTQKLAFGELKIGEQVIASTCNLIDGETLFAFKIGWHPDFKSGSPGVWSELELRNAVQSELPLITLIDSCSQPDSYLDAIWPDRIACRRSYFVQSRRSKIVCFSRKVLRRLRLNLKRRSATLEQS